MPKAGFKVNLLSNCALVIENEVNRMNISVLYFNYKG